MEPAEERGVRPTVSKKSPQEDLLSNDPPTNADWLGKQEIRSDERLLATLTPAQCQELTLLLRGMSTGGLVVDLAAKERSLDAALWAGLTAAQRAEAELIIRGESTSGRVVDLDAIEESLDHRLR
jgi:hypothetical protein